MELDRDFERIAKANPGMTDGLFPIFHHETRLDQEATDKAGSNVYKPVPYVEIIAPGNDKERVNRKVKEEDKKRWPEQWAAFKEGNEELVFDGTPITEWPAANISMARTLKEANIYTVEQLAEVADVSIQTLGPGMMTLKTKARKWVKNTDKNAIALEAANTKISDLRAELDEIKAALALETEKPAPKKRGRKPKKIEENPE